MAGRSTNVAEPSRRDEAAERILHGLSMSLTWPAHEFFSAVCEPIDDSPIEPAEIGIAVTTGKKTEVAAVSGGNGFDPWASGKFQQRPDGHNRVVFAGEDGHRLLDRG